MSLAFSISEFAAVVPLASVLGLAALLLKRWWTQQDNAMAAAIEASNKEGARCEERLAALRVRHDKEIAELSDEVERLQAVVRQLIPVVAPEIQTQLWDLMWSRNDVADTAPRSPAS